MKQNEAMLITAYYDLDNHCVVFISNDQLAEYLKMAEDLGIHLEYLIEDDDLEFLHCVIKILI